MKKLLLLFIVMSLTACVSHPEQPGRVEKITLEDGRVVEMYVFGYSIEDFKCEFERGEMCLNQTKGVPSEIW